MVVRNGRIGSLLLAGVLGILSIAELDAQSGVNTWVIDQDLSLAWWQMEPHLGHLWATTCPGQSSWEAGEGGDMGSKGEDFEMPPERYAAVASSRIPMFPRLEVEPVCDRGIRGVFSVPDTVSFTGVRGTVLVDGDAVTMGDSRRDALAHTILESRKYPIRFRLDSLVDVIPGDTLRATALGVFAVHGVEQPMSARVVGWPEAGGLRVLANFSIPAKSMITVYKMSKWKLGLGVATNIWRTVHMGVDVVLRPEAR